jgi:hypothetical protein
VVQNLSRMWSFMVLPVYSFSRIITNVFLQCFISWFIFQNPFWLSEFTLQNPFWMYSYMAWILSLVSSIFLSQLVLLGRKLRNELKRKVIHKI